MRRQAVRGCAGLLVLVACGPQASNSTTDSSTETTSTTTVTPTEVMTTVTTTEVTSTSATSSTSSTPTEATTEEPTGGACALPPLSDEVFDALGFGVAGSTFELQPGATSSLSLGRIECCYVKEPVEACVVYSVSPSEGASIDAATGELVIAADAAAGSVYTVTADVESGRGVFEATVYVYTPESNPLVGSWHEIAQVPCGGGAEVPPTAPIGELRFRANGEVLVTWQPFEIYVDYWADYTADLMSGALSLTPTGGNYVPDDIDGDGTFNIEGEELVLGDMWLGSAFEAMTPAACGHRFAR